MDDATSRIGLFFSACLDPRFGSAGEVDDGLRDVADRLRRIAARDPEGFESGCIYTQGIGSGARDLRSIEVKIPSALMTDEEQATLDADLHTLAPYTSGDQIPVRRTWPDGACRQDIIDAGPLLPRPGSDLPDD